MSSGESKYVRTHTYTDTLCVCDPHAKHMNAYENETMKVLSCVSYKFELEIDENFKQDF